MDSAEDVKKTAVDKTEDAKSAGGNTISAAQSKVANIGGECEGGGKTDEAKKTMEEGKNQGGGMLDQAGKKINEGVDNVKSGFSS